MLYSAAAFTVSPATDLRLYHLKLSLKIAHKEVKNVPVDNNILPYAPSPSPCLRKYSPKRAGRFTYIVNTRTSFYVGASLQEKTWPVYSWHVCTLIPRTHSERVVYICQLCYHRKISLLVRHNTISPFLVSNFISSPSDTSECSQVLRRLRSPVVNDERKRVSIGGLVQISESVIHFTMLSFVGPHILD
jgi:hypothetical protein